MTLSARSMKTGSSKPTPTQSSAGSTWRRRALAAGFILISLLTPANAQEESIADVLDEPGLNLSHAPTRARVAARIQQIQELRRERARALATQRGLPLRITRPNGVIQEIAAFHEDRPLYRTTQNANAAISTGANLVRSTYAVNGSTVVIGMWDGGSGHSTHQEFGSRMVAMDGAASVDHATHVGGTLIASGVEAWPPPPSCTATTGQTTTRK